MTSVLLEDAPVRLRPVCDHPGPTCEVSVTVVGDGDDDGVSVCYAEGRERSQLVTVENRRGKLVCLVWAHATADDPTHEIEIDPATYAPKEAKSCPRS